MLFELIPEEDVINKTIQLVPIKDVQIKQPKKRIAGDGIWRHIRKRAFISPCFNTPKPSKLSRVKEQKRLKLFPEIGIAGYQSSKLLRAKYPEERIKTIKLKDYYVMSQL